MAKGVNISGALFIQSDKLAISQTDDAISIDFPSGTATGTDTYAVTITGIEAYVEGLVIGVEFTNANTGSSTINVNSIGVKTLKKSVSTNLAASDLPAGGTFLLYYDGTNFQVIGLGVGGSGDVVGPTSSTDNAIARYDSTTGKLLQNSVVLLGDDGTLGNVNSIKFDTTYTGTPVEGELYWDSDEHTLNLKTGLDSTTLNIGREMNVLVMNSTGSTISNGKVVYINGSSGTKPTVALAQANDYTKSAKTIGIATMDILNG